MPHQRLKVSFVIYQKYLICMKHKNVSKLIDIEKFNVCIPESFDTNNIHQLLDYKIIFVNSQH